MFAQSDPIGYAAGANSYAYVLNDPLNATDSAGLDGASFSHWGGSCELCNAVAILNSDGSATIIGSRLSFGGIGAAFASGLESLPGWSSTPGFDPTQEGGDGSSIATNLNLPQQQQQQTSQCGATPSYSTADAARDVGEWSSFLGSGLEVGGAVVGVFFPPAGAVLAGTGLALNAAGTVLVAGADLYQRRYGAFAGDLAAGAAGFGAGRLAVHYGSGAWRGAYGRYIKNPLGGHGSEQFSSTLSNIIRCPQ